MSRDNDRQNVLNVSECITDEKGFDKIIVAMLKLCFETCIFRLPVAHGLSGLSGELSEFAMYRPLGVAQDIGGASSYVGLSMG